jgi:hypothetical protein
MSLLGAPEETDLVALPTCELLTAAASHLIHFDLQEVEADPAFAKNVAASCSALRACRNLLSLVWCL